MKTQVFYPFYVLSLFNFLLCHAFLNIIPHVYLAFVICAFDIISKNHPEYYVVKDFPWALLIEIPVLCLIFNYLFILTDFTIIFTFLFFRLYRCVFINITYLVCILLFFYILLGLVFDNQLLIISNFSLRETTILPTFNISRFPQ